MNKKIVLYLLCIVTTLHPDSTIGGLPLRGDKLFVGVLENRQKQFEKVVQERAFQLKEKNDTEAELKTLADETQQQINQVGEQLEKKKSQFLRQKQLLLNELYQVARDIVRTRERIIGMLDETSKALKEFLDDPDFNNFKKEHRLSERLFYSFDDIERLYNLMLDQEKRVTILTDQEKHAIAELESRKRVQIATKDAYAAKKELIEKNNYAIHESIDTTERSDLITLEEKIYAYKKVIDSLLVREAEYKIDLVSIELSVAKSQLAIFRDYLRSIKPAVRVTEADISHAKDELAKLSTQYRLTKETLRSEIDTLLVRQELLQREVQDVAKRHGIILGHEIQAWSKQTLTTFEAYDSYCEVASMQAQLFAYQRRQELLEGQITLEDEKMKYDGLRLAVKESYHKKFTTEEEIAAELKRYDGPKAESRTGLSRYKERIAIVADTMNAQKKILDSLVTLHAEIEKQRDTIFRSHATNYHHCLDLLRRAETFEKEQIDILSKLAGVYSGLSSLLNNKMRLISFITVELESRTIWYRPEYAITWHGVKSIIPDSITFLMFVRNYFTRGIVSGTINRLVHGLKDPFGLALLVAKLIFLIVLLIIIYRLLPRVITTLKLVNNRGIIRIFSMLCAGIATYFYTYFYSISFWVIAFALLFFQGMVDTYLYILFYLFSIPYLLYLANRFIRTMALFNQENEYAFIAQDFQRRFWVVLSVLLYATITIVFFRQAFMLAHYYRSELPIILLAVNFIIFQISLILLIDKEQILGFIPTRTDFWQRIHEQVDRFYYIMLLLLIAVIIMSNPYVGFGRLVLYGLFGLVYTIALFIVLYWAHGVLKKIASRLFFTSIDDVARERFSSAKSWFGITLIVSFLTLSFLGIVVGAKIWGWPITLSKVMDLFKYPLIGSETENPITIITFFKILGFVLIGFIAAYGINKFVLDRIFDLLLVDPGVQHTVSSITQYLVIITAAFLGFQNANLGALVNYIVGALILGLGWVLKDPISDFVAYFIILVQRPIKIGDYIKIDENIAGVVRKITARAVILRYKNSTTIIVPNSSVIGKTVTNWNYTRNFIAFDDIIVHVDYAEDPERVRDILYAVVEQHPNILKNPKPWIRLDEFSEYGFVFMVRGFISSVYTLEKWEIASTIRINIAKVFAQQGIKFAIPTRILLTRTHSLGDPLGTIPSRDHN